MKQVATLRKLKYLLIKDSLTKIYTTFILPILEYASEVWDGCTNTDFLTLEKVQLEAVRIITGLPVFASKDALYFETGWEPLSERKKRKKTFAVL